MTEPRPITIPLVNPNEPTALLAEVCVTSGQYVHAGDRLCTLETTKATLQLNTDDDGYIVGLAYQVGQTVQAGDILCYIANTPDWEPPISAQVISTGTLLAPEGLRISQPALQLARQHNLDISVFSSDVFVTEKMVRDLIDSSPRVKPTLETQYYDPTSILVYGGGGHGKALVDLIRILGTNPIAGIVDDGIPVGTNIMGVPVLGGSNVLEHLFDCGIHLAANAVGGIGNIASRIKVFERLSQVGFTCPTLIHPSAFIEPSATFNDGVQVMPLAYVGSEAQVGFGVIINTGVIVSHDCLLSDYVNLSPGAILAGEVDVGEGSLVGMGVTVNLRVKIGKRARIGNGATVKQDVPDNAIVHAGSIWPTST